MRYIIYAFLFSTAMAISAAEPLNVGDVLTMSAVAYFTDAEKLELEKVNNSPKGTAEVLYTIHIKRASNVDWALSNRGEQAALRAAATNLKKYIDSQKEQPKTKKEGPISWFTSKMKSTN